jgi:enoyl-CoA hydratase/carnithine racemase
MPITAKSFVYQPDDSSAIATITLDRAERLNALTFEVYRELRDTFRALPQERGVRAVVLTGKGRAFCSGGDVEDIIGELLGKPREDLVEFTRLTCDLILAMRECPQPVICAANGLVAGAGAVIASACDFRIAAESAKIAFLFTRVGLSGADMGASWLLPRLVGWGKATELLMTGEFIDAAEALRIGLYHRVVTAEQVVPEAMALAKKLAQGPSFALGVTKDALQREASMDLRTALEFEAQVQAVCMESPNFREAHAAFKAKRDPEFV